MIAASARHLLPKVARRRLGPVRRTLPLLVALYAVAAIGQDGMLAVPVTHDAGAARGTGPAISVVFTNLSGHPTAQVPGLPPGTEFQPGDGTANFGRPFGSPNGHWILDAHTTLATTEDEVILVDGIVVAREGTPVGVAGSSDNVGVIDARLGINDAGDWAYATNTDAATSADEVIVAVTGGVPTYVAREGALVIAVPGASYGAALHSAVIAADGSIGFAAIGMTGVPTDQEDILVLADAVTAQSGVDAPGNQLGSELWQNFDTEDYWITPDGSRWLAQGDLTGDSATDDVAVVDGEVVAQEGIVLAGSGFAEPVDLFGIVGVSLAPGGRWFVRGNNDGTEVDWIYSNGELLATLGSPVTGDPAEFWSDLEYASCFFLHVGDSAGNFVIGGVSNAASANNGLLVLNNETVVAREGDPVDIDGNGQFDDDAFFNTFGNDDAMLTDAGRFYFTSTIKNSVGTVIGQGFFVAELDLPVTDRIFADGFEL